MGDKVIMDKEVFVRIADIIRFKQDHENLLSLIDILASLEDNLYVLVDEAGNELYGTLVGQKVIAEAVADAAGDVPSAEEFNALLASLRAAGLL